MGTSVSAKFAGASPSIRKGHVDPEKHTETEWFDNIATCWGPL